MRITLDQHELYRDAERARVARWFGDGLLEPVFFDDARHALPVRAHARDEWLAEAGRIIDRHIAQQRWVPFESIAMALVLMSAMLFVTGMFGDAAPVLRRLPPPAAAAGAMLWPLIHQSLYRRRLRTLRQEIHDRLIVRAAIDPGLVPLGKRYNLFAGASAVLVYVVIAWGIVTAIAHGGVPDPLPTIVLFPVIWGLYFAGRRVDRTQRRRLSTARLPPGADGPP